MRRKMKIRYFLFTHACFIVDFHLAEFQSFDAKLHHDHIPTHRFLLASELFYFSVTKRLTALTGADGERVHPNVRPVEEVKDVDFEIPLFFPTRWKTIFLPVNNSIINQNMSGQVRCGAYAGAARPSSFQIGKEKRKLGTYAMKRVAAGAHVPTPWLFEPAKTPRR